jgi:hypothetical protein
MRPWGACVRGVWRLVEGALEGARPRRKGLPQGRDGCSTSNDEVNGGTREARSMEGHCPEWRSRRRNARQRREVSPDGGAATGAGEHGAQRRGMRRRREGAGAIARHRGKNQIEPFFSTYRWHWWVIIHQLHDQIHIGWFWSSKRGAPKLHLHLYYNSMELAAPWSFGVVVFG